MLTTDQLIGSGLAILSAFMHAADGVMGTVQKYLADVRLFFRFFYLFRNSKILQFLGINYEIHYFNLTSDDRKVN